MTPKALTDIERRLTRKLTLTLLDSEATPAELAAHLIHLSGSPDDALRLLNEAEDEVRQHLASVALLLRTNRSTQPLNDGQVRDAFKDIFGG